MTLLSKKDIEKHKKMGLEFYIESRFTDLTTRLKDKEFDDTGYIKLDIIRSKGENI